MHYQASMWESSYGLGRKEEKLEIAKSLLDVLDVETIALKTGLNVTEVKKLKDKL